MATLWRQALRAPAALPVRQPQAVRRAQLQKLVSLPAFATRSLTASADSASLVRTVTFLSASDTSKLSTPARRPQGTRPARQRRDVRAQATAAAATLRRDVRERTLRLVQDARHGADAALAHHLHAQHHLRRGAHARGAREQAGERGTLRSGARPVRRGAPRAWLARARGRGRRRPG